MGYAAVEDQGIHDLVGRVNAARIAGTQDAGSRAAESICRDLFGADRRIAVYGAFAPGEARHYMFSPFRGAWSAGFLRGALEPVAALAGTPALKPGGAERIPVHVLHSQMLESAWPLFEPMRAAGLTRLLGAVEDADGVCAIANVMALV